MRKASVKKIKNYETGNVSNYEVYLPAQSSVTGKYIRKRFKHKADALACAGQLNIKLAVNTVAPLQNEIHLTLMQFSKMQTKTHTQTQINLTLQNKSKHNNTLHQIIQNISTNKEFNLFHTLKSMWKEIENQILIDKVVRW